MRILFVTLAFAPSCAIGAVRPSRLAEYLCEFGNDVTVLCSSYGGDNQDETTLNGLENVHIYEYDKQKSVYDRVDARNRSLSNAKNKVPEFLVYFLKKIYKECVQPFITLKDNIEMEKKVNAFCDVFFRNNKKCDIVITSYPPIFTLLVGKRIKEKYHIPWIMDLRDQMDSSIYPMLTRFFQQGYQKKLMKLADAVVCVSYGHASILKDKFPEMRTKIYVIHNGYKDIEHLSIKKEKGKNKKLNVVYTGGLYSGKRDVSPLLKAFIYVKKVWGIDVELAYAGSDGEILNNIAKKFKVYDHIKMYGVLPQSKVTELQENADIFLVISWNTKNEQGILTGKFYEGIRARKPILALVSGDTINSELYQLNIKYNYGFCYEECREDSFKGLCEFLRKAYLEKTTQGAITYSAKNNIEDEFNYKHLARKLETLCTKLVKQNDE